MANSSRLVQALIAALDTHKGLKAVLESLYIWLIGLSLSYEIGSNYTKRVVCDGFSLNVENVPSISKILFKELSKLSAVSLDHWSTDQPHVQDGLHFQRGASPEEIIMLLRCCIASINLLDDDQSLLLEVCEFLRKLLFILYSYENYDGCESCTAFSHIERDVRTHLVCRLLEVYMDQLIKHKALSKYIEISVFPSTLGNNICLSDVGYVQKAISVHFLLSVSGARAFEDFVKNLVWSVKENRSTPEVSLNAAVSLLLRPASVSVPSLLHAHLVSLVSDVIGTTFGHDIMGLNYRLISCYLPAFEKSVSLYHMQLSKLELRSLFSENNDSVVKSSIPMLGHRGSRVSISPMMSERLDSMITGLDFSSNLKAAKTNSEMVFALNEYVKENLHLLDESCRDVAPLFLRFLIMKVFPAESDNASLHKYKKSSLEDICLLASILKLMSCSLLQVVMYIMTGKNPTYCKISRDPLACKEYEILIGTVNSFGLYKIRFPIQAVLHENSEAHCSRTNGSKLIFVHLTGLLSVCVACGLGILAEGCLSMIMVLLNLLYLEEGSLGFLSQLYSSAMEHESPENHLAIPEVTTPCAGVNSSGTQEGHIRKCSSAVLASNFKKIQMCTMRKGPAPGLEDHEAADLEAADETCNGMVFFKCLNKHSGVTSSDCLDEELVDFVQCKQGKDYGAWLKNRMRYKQRKSERLGIQSRDKKRSTWRSARLRNRDMK